MVLDAGARALIVPMVDTAEQARAVVRAAKYPPQEWSLGWRHAADAGLQILYSGRQ